MFNFTVVCLLVHHGVWNTQDHDVFKNLITTCKRMYKYVSLNKPLIRMLFKRLTWMIESSGRIDDEIIRLRYWKLNLRLEHEYTAWYSNGTLYKRAFYRNDKLHGESMIWFPNGCMSEQSFFKNGEREGHCITWFDDGQLRSRWFYQNGKIEGTSTLWDPDGATHVHAYYRNGVRVDNTWCNFI